ncbi:MAG: CoA transferase [Porticoccaceae bacterium]|nr:CoA transferase [Porticoccaceae bacterium]
MSSTSASKQASKQPPKHLLDGIKVLDFSHYVAGPHCTRLMTEAGAEVIKVEAFAGDTARMLPVHREGRSGYFIQHNRGKKTMCMDLRKPEAQEICHELVKQADVVVENFTPGVMKKFNLDWDSLKAINPNLIMCSISCLGQEGELSHLPGFDYIGQAYSGVLGMTGQQGGYPALSGMAFGDVSTGAHAYGAIVTALFHKLRGGEGGQHLDISLLDCLFTYHEMNVQVIDASDGEMKPERSGHQHGMVAPLGLFKCQDRYLVIIAIGKQWENLLKLIGREEWSTDPRYRDLAGRAENKQDIIDAIEHWLASVGDADEAIRLLEAGHVPCAPVLGVAETMAHPHMIKRGTIQTVNDPIFGDLKIPANPLRNSQFPEPLELRAGLLGEHNREIVKQRLGYSDEKIADLENSGVFNSKNI